MIHDKPVEPVKTNVLSTLPSEFNLLIDEVDEPKYGKKSPPIKILLLSKIVFV